MPKNDKTEAVATETPQDAPAQTPSGVVFSQEQFSQLLEALGNAKTNNQGGISKDDLTEILKATGKETTELMRAVIRENKEGVNFPGISALNPLGDLANPRKRFVDAQGRPREVWFRTREREDQLTPEEIEAYNAIQEDCEARGGKWTATIQKLGVNNSRLTIKVDDHNLDGRMGMPPLLAILTELKGGPKTADLASLIARVKSLESELVKVQGQQHQQ